MGKYLDFYKRGMKNGKIPAHPKTGLTFGLCYALADISGVDCVLDADLKLFEPLNHEKPATMYWGSGTDREQLGEFTTNRQNIILLLAAMNNEL
jgi:hypothetical protein